jgi:hypothetical protein
MKKLIIDLKRDCAKILVDDKLRPAFWNKNEVLTGTGPGAPTSIVIFDGENSGTYDIDEFDLSNTCNTQNNYIRITGEFKNHTQPGLYEKFSAISYHGAFMTPSMSLLETISA